MKKITELLSIVVLFVISSGFCIPFSFWKSSCSSLEDIFTEQGNLTGSVLASASQMSPNGVYGFAKVLEKTSGNSVYHFFYTKDSGVNWTKFVTTKDSGSNFNESFSGLFENNNNGHIVVANNGKVFCLYSGNISTDRAVFGVYTDLSDASPTLSDTPSTGVDGYMTSAAAGRVGYISGNSVYGNVDADKTDLSWIAVALSSSFADMRFYSNGGATHVGVSSISISHSASSPLISVVTGSGGSHRSFILTKNGSSNINFRYFDQPNLTSTSSDVLQNGNYALRDATIAGANIAISARRISDGISVLFSLPISSPATPAERVTTQAVTLDTHLGWSSIQSENEFRALRSELKSNPSAANNLLLSYATVHPDGIRRASAVEVRDITSFVGANISQYSQNVWRGLRDITARTQMGQTLTTSSSRFRTVAVRLRQTGSVPTGHNITLEVQGQSGGFPDNTALATSINSYQADKITKNTSGQWCFFTVDTLSLTGSHSFVIKSTYPVSSSNYIEIAHSNSNPYSGGTSASYDGSTWAANSGEDFVFEVNGEWIYDFSTALASHVLGSAMWDQEVGVSLAGAGKAQLVTRRTNASSTSYLPVSGHVFKSELTFGTGTSASTFTTPSQAGYANYDPNLVFLTVPGLNNYSRKNVTTGVVDTVSAAEERSGFNHSATYTSITSADFVNDSDFLHGRAFEPQTTGRLIFYDDAPVFRNLHNRKFVLEQEVKPTNLSSQKTLFNHAIATAVNTWWGFQCFISSGDGKIGIRAANGSAFTTITSTSTGLTAGTYYRIRFVNDGTNVRIYYNLSKSGGTWVEFGYDTLNTISVFGYNTTALFSPFAFYDENSNISGPQSVISTGIRYGYAKVIVGSSTVSYDGATDVGQPGITKVIPISNKISAEQSTGQNSTTNGVNFDDFGIIKQVCQ
jgi:hypothetical protein